MRIKALAAALGTLAAIALILLLSSPSEHRIALVLSINGQFSEVGKQSRDGALLGAEELNAKGGIAGDEIVIDIHDDRSDPKTAAGIFSRISAQNSDAIIGPTTSTVAREVIDSINQKEIITLSPTVSSSYFSNRDDMFFRLGVSSEENKVGPLVAYMRKRGIERVAMLIDGSNLEYAANWEEVFTRHFEKHGGKTVLVSKIADISSSFKKKTAEQGVEGIIISASPIKTANLAQRLRIQGIELPLFESGSGFSDDIIEHGGSAVEGLVISSPFNPNDTSKRYRAFKESFIKRFGYEPTSYALRGYTAVMYIAEAFKREKDPGKLKEAILSIEKFHGPMQEVTFDRYGDSSIKNMLIKIENGQFETIR